MRAMFTLKIDNTDKLSRRQILCQLSAATSVVGTSGLLGIGSAWANEGDEIPESKLHHAGKVKSIIYYHAQGAPSQGHTFDPPQYVEAPELHPFSFAKSGQSGIEICEIFPHLQKVADDLCLIRSGYAAGAAHGAGTDFAFRGFNDFGASIGAWLLYGLGSGNRSLPGHVAILGKLPQDQWLADGGLFRSGLGCLHSGGLPSENQAMVVSDLTNPVDDIKARYHDKQQLAWLQELKELNKRHSEGRPYQSDLTARTKLFDTAYRMQTSAPEAFDFGQEFEQPAMVARYGLDKASTQTIGAKCLLARRLVERGVRFIVIPASGTPYKKSPGSVAGWDSHTEKHCLEGIPTLAESCDQPLAGLIADLKDRGLFDQTLILWGGEFGRGGKGFLNHNGDSWCWWLAGGGIKGGHIHGKTNDKSQAAVENPVHFRDLWATVMWQCGLDYRKLEYAGKKMDQRSRVIHDIIA